MAKRKGTFISLLLSLLSIYETPLIIRFFSVTSQTFVCIFSQANGSNTRNLLTLTLWVSELWAQIWTSWRKWWSRWRGPSLYPECNRGVHPPKPPWRRRIGLRPAILQRHRQLGKVSSGRPLAGSFLEFPARCSLGVSELRSLRGTDTATNEVNDNRYPITTIGNAI